MLSMDDLLAMERRVHECVSCANDTGGLSLVEAADLSTQINWRLLTEYKELRQAHDRVMGELRYATIII